jgi:hypothetical protein
VAELPELLMSCRFLPMSCWFLARAAGRLLSVCSRGTPSARRRQFFQCRGARPRRCVFHTAGPPNTADKLRSGAPVQVAGGGTGRHLSLAYGCRPELRQLHPLVRRPLPVRICFPDESRHVSIG